MKIRFRVAKSAPPVPGSWWVLALGLAVCIHGFGIPLPASAQEGGNEPNQGVENPGWHYDPVTAIAVPQAIPWVRNNIRVSPGEQVIFNVRATDQDRRRPNPMGAWENINPGPGPYEVRWTISANAEWDAAGSGRVNKTTAGLTSGNVNMFVAAGWDGTGTITVTAQFVDLAPNPVPGPPDTGTTRDASVTVTWTFIRRVRCPESTEEVVPGAPHNQWRAAPAVYTYLMNPDVAPVGRPDYENETILETFGNVSAVGFTMDDLTEAWKTANPTQNTPDRVAIFLWNSSNNGTFVVNNQDRISDRHGGFGTVAPFTAAAIARGFGFTKPQQYRCGGNVIGNYTIERRHQAGTITIRKTGP